MVGKEYEPPGPEKLALGNVRRGELCASVNGRDRDDPELEVELRKVGDDRDSFVRGDCRTASKADGSDGDDEA